MPSDAVTIAVALASPTAAGVVAVLIHRERLAHERRLSDLSVSRDVLARAVAAGIKVERAAEDWDNAYVAHVRNEDPHLAAAIAEAIAAWRAHAATLAIVFPKDHPVIDAADKVEMGVIEIAYYVEEYHDRGRDAFGVRSATTKLAEALDKLRAAARGVAQARL
jgi:hypothetical protein